MRHRRHVFVCVQRRDGGGKPACGERGGRELLAALEGELAAHPDARAGVTGSLCLGPCFDGPNAVIYPDGAWYAGLAVTDAAAIADHVCTGAVAPTLAAKRHPWSDDEEP